MKLSIVILTVLLLSSAGCNRSTEHEFHGDALEIDDRYSQEIVFQALDTTIPLKENAYIRADVMITDTTEHVRLVLNELGITGKKVVLSNAATGGGTMCLRFRDGKKCSFIWFKQDEDLRMTKKRLEHEKYHALYRLMPEAVDILSANLSQMGFDLNLSDYDEELAATLIEIVALHRDGVPLEDIQGSELVMEAVGILKNNRIEPRKASSAKGIKPDRSETN